MQLLSIVFGFSLHSDKDSKKNLPVINIYIESEINTYFFCAYINPFSTPKTYIWNHVGLKHKGLGFFFTNYPKFER